MSKKRNHHKADVSTEEFNTHAIQQDTDAGLTTDANNQGLEGADENDRTNDSAEHVVTIAQPDSENDSVPAIVPKKPNAIVTFMSSLPGNVYTVVTSQVSNAIEAIRKISSAVYKFVGAQLGKLAQGVSTVYGKATTGLSSLHTSYTKPAIDKVGKFYSGYNQYESKYAECSAYAVVGALAGAASYMVLELNFPVAHVAAGAAIAVVASLTLASTMPKYFGGFGYAMSNAILTPLTFAANKISAGYNAVAAAASRVSKFAHAQYEKLSNAVLNNDTLTVAGGAENAKVGSSIFLAPVSYLSGFFNELSKVVSGKQNGKDQGEPLDAANQTKTSATITAGGA